MFLLSPLSREGLLFMFMTHNLCHNNLARRMAGRLSSKSELNFKICGFRKRRFTLKYFSKQPRLSATQLRGCFSPMRNYKVAVLIIFQDCLRMIGLFYSWWSYWRRQSQSDKTVYGLQRSPMVSPRTQSYGLLFNFPCRITTACITLCLISVRTYFSSSSSSSGYPLNCLLFV